LNITQRIAKNTVVLWLSDIISKILGFLYVMYVARYLGAEGFGILSFALAFTGIFGVFTDLGLQQLMVREIARDKSSADKYIGNIILIKVILVILTFNLIIITINLLDYPEKTVKVVYLIALAFIFNTFTNIFNSIFQAFEKMEFVSLGKILNNLIIFFGALYAINQELDVVYFAFIHFFANLLILVYSFIISTLKFIKELKIEINWNFWKFIIKEALPFGLSTIFVTIFYWVDSVMLSLMKDDTTVGWYNAAYRIVLFLLFIPTSFNAAIYPILSRFFIDSHDLLKITFERAFRYLTIIGTLIGIEITILAEKIILFIFGIEYINSIMSLQILVWSSVFIFMSQPIANLFNSLNKQILTTRIAGICVILNIILNLILIPKYSLIGASIATVLTEFLSLLLHSIQASKIGYDIFREYKNTILGINNLNLFILILLTVLIYFILLYIFRCIDKKDINLIKNLLLRGE